MASTEFERKKSYEVSRAGLISNILKGLVNRVIPGHLFQNKRQINPSCISYDEEGSTMHDKSLHFVKTAYFIACSILLLPL